MRIKENFQRSALIKIIRSMMNQNGITIAMLQETQLQETIEDQFEIKKLPNSDLEQLKFPSFDELHSKIAMEREVYDKAHKIINSLGEFQYYSLEPFYAEHTPEFYKIIKPDNLGLLRRLFPYIYKLLKA